MDQYIRRMLDVSVVNYVIMVNRGVTDREVAAGNLARTSSYRIDLLRAAAAKQPDDAAAALLLDAARLAEEGSNEDSPPGGVHHRLNGT